MTLEEFKSSIYEFYKDPVYEDFMNGFPVMDESHFYSEVKKEYGDDIPTDMLVTPSDELSGFDSVSINALKNICLHFLGDLADQVKNIPVGIIPTKLMNACAVSSDEHYVILLDNGTFRMIEPIIHFYMAIDGYYTPTPHSHNFTQHEFADAMISLAQWYNSGKILPQPDKLKYYRDIVVIGDKFPYFRLYSTVFMILHEYAHIILKHIDKKIFYHHLNKKSGTFSTYSRSWQHELEADLFAINVMLKATEQHWTTQDVAIYPGFIFLFYDLCIKIQGISPLQYQDSHPPPLLRWEQIKYITNVRSNELCYAYRMDDVFDWIYQQY